MKQLLAGALLVALFHITPTVILVKRTDAVKQLLPDAEQMFMRDVHLSKGDADRLSKDAADWSPPDDELTFYIGKVDGKPVGVIEFIRVDTPHGPIEVAVGFDEHQTVHRVIVTKATTETKPWVLEALGAGLTDSYRGMKPTDIPHGSESIKGKVGDPAIFITNLIDQGVLRALVAYRDFYASSGNLGTRNQVANRRGLANTD
jgi:hypothetical protein